MNSISKKNTELKDPSITWLRAIATLMVVITHCLVKIVNIEQSPLRFAGLVIDGFVRMCVPLFVMISGHLLWSRKTEPTFDLVLKRFWSIFHIIAYFGIVYYVYDTFTGQGHYPFWTVFFNFTPSGLWRTFLWYMFAVLPIYILTPFISLPLGKSQRFYTKFSIILIFLFLLTESVKSAPLNINSYYSLNVILLYFLLGFSLGQIQFSKKHAYLFILIAFTSLMILSISEWFDSERGRHFFSISSFFLFVESLTFFIFIRSLDFNQIFSHKIGRGLDNIFKIFAKYSIGIYGWHTIVQFHIVYPILQQVNLRGTIIFLMTVIFTITGSLLIAIVDYHFWKKINKWLNPIYQKIKNTFYSFNQNII